MSEPFLYGGSAHRWRWCFASYIGFASVELTTVRTISSLPPQAFPLFFPLAFLLSRRLACWCTLPRIVITLRTGTPIFLYLDVAQETISDASSFLALSPVSSFLFFLPEASGPGGERGHFRVVQFVTRRRRRDRLVNRGREKEAQT